MGLCDGPGHFGFGVQCKCITKTDMGKDGETYATVVSNSAKDGESAENNTHGVIAGNNCGY